MGLFDDFIGLARDINGLKEEFTSTGKQVVKEATDFRDEAVKTARDLQSEATSTVDDAKKHYTDTKKQVMDGVKRQVKGDE